MESEKVLVSGATGYVGGRLIPRLLQDGYTVRAISRSRKKLNRAGWSDHDDVELREADALDGQSMKSVFRGCQYAYYLIHSMGMGSGDFADADRRAARNFLEAADSSSVERVLYLGGLGHHHDDLSKHRRSRREVADILQSGEVPVTVLRAAMIVGAGSGSFELTRYCVEKMPVMITHQYVNTPSQPIAIGDVLTYLTGCLERSDTSGKNYEIGGPDVLTGVEVMQIYAREAGLFPRIVLPSSLVSLDWSARWTTRIVPLPDDLTYPLVKGARNPAVVRNDRIRDVIPQDLTSVEVAMRQALEHPGRVSDTPAKIRGTLQPAEWPRDYDPDWAGGRTYVDERTIRIEATTNEVWNALIEIGSENGLYFSPWFRSLVRWVDNILGVFDFPETERSKPELTVEDTLDFWAVDELTPGERLKLRGDFNLPGQPHLIYTLKSEDGVTICRQRAEFRPAGLFGRIYWSVMYALHFFSFNLMLKNIARRAGDRCHGDPVRVEA